MSNSETTIPIGDWTIGSLKVYEDEKLTLLKQLMDERKEHLKELRLADQRAIDAALVSQEKAIVKAETAADKRFELLNELREGVATKEQVEALDKVMDAINSRLDKIEGKSAGFWLIWVAALGLVGAVGTILAFKN